MGCGHPRSSILEKLVASLFWLLYITSIYIYKYITMDSHIIYYHMFLYVINFCHVLSDNII